MRHNRIKIVTSKNGNKLYYVGDGMWFGRISEKKALDGLSNGKYFFWSID
jgi:hypothetical protein